MTETSATNTSNPNTLSARQQRKQQKKQAALQQRRLRLQKRGPPTRFVGTHKWLGGAVDPSTGRIYGVPSHSYRVICITPSSPSVPATIDTITLPNEYQGGKFKWLRGLVFNGCLYGIPAWCGKGVLKMQLESQKVTVLELPSGENASLYSSYETDEADAFSVDRRRWMWHGGAVGVSPNGTSAIYCIPSNARRVLKVHLDGETPDVVEEIGMVLENGQNKWYGGIKVSRVMNAAIDDACLQI